MFKYCSNFAGRYRFCKEKNDKEECGKGEIKIDLQSPSPAVVGNAVGGGVSLGVHTWLKLNSVSGPFVVAVALRRVSAVGVNT